jgi:WD40 repeat protein
VAVAGEVIASSGSDRTIKLWSLASGLCTGTIVGCAERVTGLALRDELLLSGEAESGGGGKVRLWLLDGPRSRGAPAAVFTEHTGCAASDPHPFPDAKRGVSVRVSRVARTRVLADAARDVAWCRVPWCGGLLPRVAVTCGASPLGRAQERRWG